MTKQELIQFICRIYNLKQCSEMILRQINKYVTERRYNYLDIARALSYYFEVEEHEPQIQYGIGIVPFVIDKARKYFEDIERQKQAQIKAAQEQKLKNQENKQIIYIKVKKEKTIHKPNIDINKL